MTKSKTATVPSIRPPDKKTDKKTAGRPEGSKGKRTLELDEIMEKRGFDPAIFLMDIAQGKMKFETVLQTSEGKPDKIVKIPAPLEIRARAGETLMKYKYPARKAVEITTPPGQGFQIEVVTITGESS